MGRTPWEVLGLREGSTPAEIRAAHRRLSRHLHPDRYATAPEAVQVAASAVMAEVNAAATVLLAAARNFEPASADLVRWRPRNRWDEALAPEAPRGCNADLAA